MVQIERTNENIILIIHTYKFLRFEMQKNSIKEDISVDRILWMFTFQTIKKNQAFLSRLFSAFLHMPPPVVM